MSNSLDSFLTRIGDVTIERVTPRGNPRVGDHPDDGRNVLIRSNENIPNLQSLHDRDLDETSREISDGEHDRNMERMVARQIEEIHSEGSGDDMDLDETIDTEIGVRMDSERQHSESSCPDDDVEAVNILDTLPLEGAPIEGQEVSEADLLGKPLLKEDDGESIDNDKSETQSGDEDDETHKRRTDSDDSDPAKKKQKKDDGDDSECELKSEKKLANMRRNIREVMDETQLDEATLAAQRQEMERLRRVQEQQKIIREVQRQIAINRQNSKNQTRVISLLQGKQNELNTSISQSSSSPSSSQVKLPNTVLLKVNNSASGTPQVPPGAPFGPMPRRPMENARWQKGGRGSFQNSQTSISRVPSRQSSGQNVLQQRIRMMTPSVSISPVVPKKEPCDKSEYFSDSEPSEPETDDMMYQKQMHHAMRKTSGAPKLPKPPKGKDVVTISSSSESSDDDCIVLSDPSGGEETDNDDDPSNSGMHTNDRYNVPDEHGRVLVNVGHPETEPDVYLAPQVARVIKPHQIGGIRFLFDNIIESIERYKSSTGFGCILAHSMGLGKTLQVASFCDIFFRCTTAKTVLCIMPINTLQNWLAEFNMWLPYEDPNAVKPEIFTNNKSDSSVSVKNEIKEENSNMTDQSSGMSSRPISTESAHRPMQDNSTQISNMVSGHAFNNPQFENHNSMPNYYQDGMMNKPMNHNVPIHQNFTNMPQSSTYHQNMNQIDEYKPVKSEMECRDMNESSGSQRYRGVDSQNLPIYPMMNQQQMPGYTNYQTSPGNQQQFSSNTSLVKVKQEIQNEPMHIKEEPKESMIKEETGAAKDDGNEEKKSQKVSTPFNVDTPIGLELRPRHFRLHILNDSHKTMAARAKVIQEWQKVGGVLLIGYELYRQLSLKKPNKAKRKRGQPFKDTVDVEEEDKNKSLLDEMHGALVNPGPDLVICDEGHRIKNSHASISLALKQMRTKRRIVLTGYPLQNNLLEYWCMVDFVRPNYLGTKSEFCNMFERPIQNGQCIDSTPQDIRLMRYRAHVLHALLEGFVQRRSHSVLQVSLPRKEEYILLVRMTPHQRKLYDTFMNQVVKTRAVPNPLKAFAVCCKIWNHPDILFHFLRKRQTNEEDDLDLEETIAEKTTPGGKRSKARQPKGESKKGKKGNVNTVKNKPAASVPPNSSSASTVNNEVTPPENVINTKDTTENYSNFNHPLTQSNSNFNNSNPQTAYPQNYQNFRPNDQNNFYRNDQNTTGGEYNQTTYYNNESQPKFPNQEPPFQTYQQGNVNQQQLNNFNTTQGYQQNQSQAFNSSNDQTTSNTQQKYSNPSNADFNANQSNTDNYEIFQKQQYCYQEQERNYQSNVNQAYQSQNAIHANQPINFDSQMPNQPNNNMPMNNYSSYSQPNQSQNYLPGNVTGSGGNNMQQIYQRNENQPMQNQPINYPENQQQNSSSSTQPPAPAPTGYMANQGYLPIQQNTNQIMPNPYTGSTGRVNQPAVPIQNSRAAPSNQTNTNVTSNQSQPIYPSNQASQTGIVQNHPHGFMNNQQNQPIMSQNQPMMSQNQSRSYTATQQNSQHQYSSTQVPYQPSLQTQTQVPTQQIHEYTADTPSNTALASSKHGGYPPSLNPTPAPQNSYTMSQSIQPSTPGNQNHSYSSSTTQQAPISPMPNQQHRYPAGSQNQSTIPSNMPSNQSTNYPQGNNQHSNTPAINQGDQQNFPGHYQMNQTQQQNSGLPNYQNNSNQNQYKGPDDNYPSWQNNYPQSIRQDQCNDQYFREPNSNRYDNNYFSQQNYVQNAYDFNAGQNMNINSGSNKDNMSQATMMDQMQSTASNFEKMNKDVSTNVGVQSQPLAQNTANANPTFNPNDNNAAKQNMNAFIGNNNRHAMPNPMNPIKEEEKEKDEVPVTDKEKDEKSDDEIVAKEEEKDTKIFSAVKEEPGIPYDWATELMKGYVPGLIDASAKMTLFFCILEKAIFVGDRVLAFSQSLFTLNLIEDFLSRNNLKYPDGQTESWVKNVNYYRLDGSTSALEREKLINEFNQNSKIHLFLVSTRAGSLGINLVGANRAIVFDASWNPCHDTQAVCRVYRYGQQKPCYVYRLVTDNCLERKIYDRQISKQGMADRVVDQCNPDAHLSLKEATTLSWDWEEDSQVQDFSSSKSDYSDEVMHHVLEKYSSLLTKQPFHHESLLVDRKDKKLSQAEKRLARRGYELEKMAANCSKPSYNYVPGNTATRAGGLQIRAIRGGDTGVAQKPVASVRPMQQRGAENLGTRGIVGSRWIPAEVWQRQGMSAQEMTLPLDVVIPTNSPDKSSIVLKAGQRVMVLKSPKGIYMQLESGKIIAIRTALKINQQKREEEPKKAPTSAAQRNTKPEVSFPLRNNSAISIIPKSTSTTPTPRIPPRPNSGMSCKQQSDREPVKRPRAVPTPASKMNTSQINLTQQVSLQRVPKIKHDSMDGSLVGDNSNSSDSQPRTDQRVEEVRLEDVVAEAANSNPDYSPSNQSQTANSDSEPGLSKSFERKSQDFGQSPVTPGKTMQGSQSQRIKSETEMALKHDKSRTSAYDMKDCESASTNYGSQYPPHMRKNPNQPNANEDIAIEETQATMTAPLPPHPSQMMQQQVQQEMSQENRSVRPPQAYVERPTDVPKTIGDSINPPTTGTSSTFKNHGITETQGVSVGESHRLPQAYPYSQYPRYYDYGDPRSRTMPNPYGSYYPNVPPSTNSTSRPVEPVPKAVPEAEKSSDERQPVMPPTPTTAYASQPPVSIAPTSITSPAPAVELREVKNPPETVPPIPTTTHNRTDAHIPTAFNHPAGGRFTGSYPPGPYDPYSQHYPAAPNSTPAYPPSGAPGYTAYGGPAYNAEYAHMYSAFHGPPPTADPYMHRGYAPTSTHPSNYYTPFPHPPPPPYPNYSFLPPYPNPNMPSESQPPAQ